MTREIPLKAWIIEQAEHERQHIRAVWMRYYRGKYPGLKLRRVNRRVIFVEVKEP